MKKNKLYTANRWNQPAFMVDRQRHNIFDGFTLGQSNQMNSNPFGVANTNTPLTGNVFLTNGNSLFTPQLSTGAQNAVNANINKSLPKGGSGGGGLFGSGGGGNTMTSIGGVVGALGSINTGDPRGMWDTLDPVYHLAGGRESAAGNAMSDAGVSLTQAGLSSGQPYLALAGAGLKVIGGLTNAAFGIKENTALKKAVEEGINRNKNFVSTAGSFDDVKGPVAATTNTNVYEGGWFSGGKARRKNEELKRRMIDAKTWANRSVDNNIFNLQSDQMNDALANFSAFGGPLDYYNNDNMSAVNYGFMSDYLTQKKKQAEQKNNINNLFAGMPNTLFADGGYMTEQEAEKAAADSFHNNVIWNSNLPFGLKGYSTLGKETFNNMLGNIQQSAIPYAFGGDMQTNGGDYSTGLVHIGAGLSHEENPNEGVQLGIDSEGIPNLVEENETVWNDYVFSARIPIDQTTKEMFHIGKKSEMTYADLSKKLEKEIAERPNDPISKAGFEKQMQMLEEQQERQKQEKEAERAKAAFEALSPEEQTALMQQRAEQEAMAQQAAMQEAAAQQRPTPEEIDMVQQQIQQMQQADGSNAVLGQEPEMAANGGKLYKEGGDTKKNAGTWKKGTSKENWDKYSRNGLRDFLMKVNDDLANADTEEEKNKIRENAIKTVRGIQQAYSEAYQNNLTPSEVNEKVTALQKAFQDAGGNAYFGDIADNINLPKGHNTADTEEKGWVDGLWGPRTSIRNWGSTEYGDDYDDIRELAASAGLTYAPGQYKYGDNTLYELGMAQPDVAATPDAELEAAWDYGDPSMPKDANGNIVATASATPEAPAQSEEKKVVPDLKKETYFGLFGPAVGLGLMGLGVGKPDTGSYDAAASGAGNYTTANWKPLGNYLTYRPLDIWYEQNALNAQSRATDRALANNSGGNRGTAMAGLIANGYNSQLASGNLFRQAQEYNDNLRKQVEDFNRGTDQFNSEQYGATSRFNADAYNNANRASAQMKLHAASAKDDANRWWASNLYGNINSLFDNINQWEKWKRDHNSVARMAANGIFGVGTEDTPVFGGYVKESKKSKGGKLKKKRGLTI